ncbi:HTTM domain-containing protein [Sphingomonas gei]|uniref:HTTM domain-containing protein n=1 Tax=Sphingomonas gei TaxID=1395960 RepID=A0A4S1X3W9_9SPHN|nr:HTTM domain-containing protein [Sphingomonas gei]TGX49610.1 HTTM domain-containing protein [Sphingomonas gei]
MISMARAAARTRVFAGRTFRSFAQVFAIDLRSLAAFRVILGAALLLRVLEILPNAAAFLSDEGVLPRGRFGQFDYADRASLYLLNGTPCFAIALLWLEGAGAICLIAGVRPRISAALCWVLHQSLVLRNPFIGSGGDVLAPLLLFWAMFLPIGARFSTEAVLAEPSAPTRVLNVATAGLLLQASYVYFFGAMMKTSPEWAVDGSAVYLALHNDAIATPLAYVLRGYVSVTQPLSFFVLWLEILTPILLFAPVQTDRLRLMVLPLLIAMHLGFRLFLDIGLFWVVSIASLVVFVPARFWDALHRPGRRATVAIYYEGSCGFYRKVVLLLGNILAGPTVSVLAAHDHGRMGALLTRARSWNRRFFALLTAAWTPARAYRLTPVAQVCLAWVLAFCLIWNFTGLRGVRRPQSLIAVADVAGVFGLTQSWGMFAPRPHVDYVLPVIEGRLADGSVVDVYHHHMAPPSYQWPAYPAGALGSSDWTGYFDALALRLTRNREAALLDYARYACRDWTAQHPNFPLREVRVTFLIGETLSAYASDRNAREAHRFACFV